MMDHMEPFLSVNSTTSITLDIWQTVSSQSYTIYDCAKSIDWWSNQHLISNPSQFTQTPYKKCRFQYGGTGFDADNGPQIEFYTGSAYPVRQIMNIDHNSVIDGFDCSFNGSNFISSSSNNSFAFRKFTSSFALDGDTASQGSNLSFNNVFTAQPLLFQKYWIIHPFLLTMVIFLKDWLSTRKLTIVLLYFALFSACFFLCHFMLFSMEKGQLLNMQRNSRHKTKFPDLRVFLL
jgi:hypothetical protein